jgi:hypothetical protein
VVQDDLCSIIIRSGIHQIAFTSDIEKIYRQVKIHPKDHHLQCILWRERPQDQLTTYALTTVTYGTSAAPFLATRCLKQLAHDEAENFSKAAPILLRDFYVDDCISGAETLEEALEIQSQLQDLLKSGGFTLRKWCSNSTELLATIPHELQETQHSLTDEDSDIVRTLGLIWRPSSDQFKFTSGNTSHLIAEKGLITKRLILPKISSIFDPLGLLSPVVIVFKLLMQRLWQDGSNWDDPLTPTFLKE